MMKHHYYRRKKKKNSAMFIVVLSAILMAVLMFLFFAAAWKQSNAPDTSAEAGTQTADAAQTTDADTVEDTAAVSAGIVTPDPQTPETTDAATEEFPVTETEAVTTVQITTPQNDTPVSVPDIYDEALLAAVALPEGTASEGYVDKLVFYGDSTTYGMKAYKVFGARDTTQVWTPTSGTLALFRAATDLIYDPNTGTELSLADMCSSIKPEYLIMTLGVNGISFMQEDAFKTDYQNLIDIIRKNSPDTKLILQSIYPVARSYANQDSINNTKIQTANQWITALASENDLPYLNTYSALIGEDGYLPEAYQNGDGMHFNEEGFAVVIEYVKTHPYE